MSMRQLPAELHRCYYVASGDSSSFDPRRLVPWEIILERARGRWDDPLDEYRVLYTAGSERTALIEVLSSLRPSKKSIAAIAEIEDPDDKSNADDEFVRCQQVARLAVDARLAPRFMAVLRTSPGPQAYDVSHGASRTDLEQRIGLAGRRFKTGSFTSEDTDFTRRVSRYIYEETGAVAIFCMSAEDNDGYVIVFFENGVGTGFLRVGDSLEYEGSQRAASCLAALDQALIYLNIVDDLSPKSSPTTRGPASEQTA